MGLLILNPSCVQDAKLGSVCNYPNSRLQVHVSEGDGRLGEGLLLLHGLPRGGEGNPGQQQRGPNPGRGPPLHLLRWDRVHRGGTALHCLACGEPGHAHLWP